jgi:hypothetical protein
MTLSGNSQPMNEIVEHYMLKVKFLFMVWLVYHNFIFSMISKSIKSAPNKS